MEADFRASKSTTMKVRVLPDRRLFSGKFLQYSRSTSTSPMKVYSGCGGLRLNTPDIQSQTLGWSSLYLA